MLDDLRQDFIAEERMPAALHSPSAAGRVAEHANLLARDPAHAGEKKARLEERAESNL